MHSVAVISILEKPLLSAIVGCVSLGEAWKADFTVWVPIRGRRQDLANGRPSIPSALLAGSFRSKGKGKLTRTACLGAQL